METHGDRKTYVFHDNTTERSKDSQLFARGKTQSFGFNRTVSVLFDGTHVRVPLLTSQLAFFVPERVSGVEEIRHSILYDISVVRRKTTHKDQATDATLYILPADCGVWLDLYHF